MTNTNYKKAYLAGGCFWGMEELFRKQDWVVDTQVGYMGWRESEPTYQNHSWHAEAIEVSFDPEVTSYQKVLDFFFTIHDPTTKDRQGNDRGDSYRSAIFYQNSDEKLQAEAMIEIVNQSGRWMSPVVTNLEEFKWFYDAEWYHQDYLQENINGYTCHYVRFPSYLSA